MRRRSASSLPHRRSRARTPRVAALGVFSLQHRGQESAGVAVSDGEQLMLYKDLGLIAQVLDERRLPSLRGAAGDRPLPLLDDRFDDLGERPADLPDRAAAGRSPSATTATWSIRASCSALLEGGKSRLPATTDTELLTALLADDPSGDTVEALLHVLPHGQGAYSLAILDEKRVIGVRDPFGFRPLVLGRLEPAADDPEGEAFGRLGDRSEIGRDRGRGRERRPRHRARRDRHPRRGRGAACRSASPRATSSCASSS